ncbi:flagellar basal-body rod protein FlgC [Constrictibacter sp. MBR-5]|jgi:flagellar basal-body rod protein FlgC|uniref:flagellar basal body rod protein FlgC n=1 Tax=Constrictibacter sp. MBR-5 TaxID=3156467 RepID=UPI00339A18AA
MDLVKSLQISASGMRAQGTRLRVIAENLANAQSTAQVPGGQPYQRKVVSFSNDLNRASGVEEVKADRVRLDSSEFERRYDPGHPAADADGYMLLPNVNPMVELMDMREAQRSYEANLNVLSASRSMLMRTIDMLRT